MQSLEQIIEVGPLLNMDAINSRIVNLSARKRVIMRDMKKLDFFEGPKFEMLYNDWQRVNGYLTFFKELKNSL